MIRIIGIGKVKDTFCREKMNEYLLRITKYAKVEYREVNHLPEEKTSEIIILDERGKELTSIEFSQFLQKKVMEEKNTTFLLGPAEGLPKELLAKTVQKISLSRMTLPHELARVMVLEQIYRAFTIMKNEPYHK